MFGFGSSDKKELQKLWAGFQNIRQLVLLKYNEYEQYSFATAFNNLPDEFTNCLENDLSRTKDDWRLLANDLQEFGKEGNKMYSGVGGLHGEGGRAGLLSVTYLFLLARANVLSLPEAKLFLHDMEVFRNEILAKVATQIENRARSR